MRKIINPVKRRSGSKIITHTHTHPFLLLNISMYTLAAICFMIYTTELHYAHAEGKEDLGSASSSLDASVTVGTACNFSGNVDIPHTSTIMNGVNSTDIGKTTMNVTCNDQGGYAVYAIGYANDEYGNTTLQSSISDDYNISTGTSTSGNTSNWSMKLAAVSGTTTATIENGYSSYSVVPDDYTKVASLSTITDPSTPNTGSSIATTYQTYISPTQPAGTYAGKVKYTLVHPSTAPAPEIPPKTISDLTSMQDFYNLSEYDRTGVLNSMETEVNYTLKDKRDDQDYTIAKLKDDKVWMVENLNLSGGTEITSELSDIPEGYVLPVANGFRSNNRLPSSSTDFGSENNMARLYNSNRKTNCGAIGQNIPCYSYYSWTAATAGSGLGINTDDTDAPYSICPKGWRLPTSRSFSAYESDFSLLVAAYTSQPDTNFYDQAGPNTTPNFILAGSYLGNATFSHGGEWGHYWSSTVYSDIYARGLLLFQSGASPSDWNYRRRGIPMRCVAE